MAAPYSEDLRIKIVNAYASNKYSQREIANIFSVSKDSVYRYCKKYRLTGDVKATKGNKGRPATIPNELLDSRLLPLINKHPDATLAELCRYYEKKYNVKVLISVMHRLLTKIGIKRKKKSHYAIQQDREDVALKRQNFKKISNRRH